MFLTDLAVELRAWPYGTWATLGLDPQAAAGAIIAAWPAASPSRACGLAG